MTLNKSNVSVDETRTLRVFCHQCRQKLDVTKLKAFEKISCPTCSAELIVPKWFNSYLLEERCGSGGGAVVYRSLDPTLDREVAIKIFSQKTSTPQFTEIFLHEGRVAASLNHPNIVPIYSCGQFEEQCFLVMQYMVNGSLEYRVKNCPPPRITRVLKWVLEVARALRAALQNGVIHHDVKPANILLDADDNIKIADFGLSYALNDIKSQSLLSELSTFGSPDYVSPEKLSFGFEDSKGDIFSLGVTFYELLTGQKPFKQARDDEDILEVRASIPVVLPHELRSEVSLKLSRFIMSMLEADPVKRPEYDEIISELENYLGKYSKFEDKVIYRFVAKYI
jgi:serine/threonine protein kinase